jgi:hypothetical protein
MVLPATENFTGSAGSLADPPWTLSGSAAPEKDGSGHGVGPIIYNTGFAVWNADTFPDDQYSAIDVLWNGAGNGDFLHLIVRAQPGGAEFVNYYDFLSNGHSASEIRQWDSFTPTVLASDSSITFVSGDRLKFEAVGNNLNAYKNDVLILTATDSRWTSGVPGFGLYPEGAAVVDNWEADATGGGGPGPGVHVVSGRGDFIISEPLWLSISLSGVPPRLNIGNAEPPNLYHAGMISWGSDNGVMTAYPVTRELDLVAIPAGMTVLHYEFADPIAATITELTEP